MRDYVISHQRLHSEINQLQHALDAYNYDLSNLDWFNSVKRYNSIVEYNNELFIRKQKVETLLHEQGLLGPYRENIDAAYTAIADNSQRLLQYYEINSIDTVSISQNINELQQQINAYTRLLERINNASDKHIPAILLNQNLSAQTAIELINSPALLIVLVSSTVAVLSIFGLTLRKIVHRVYFSHPNPVICLNKKGKVLCFNKSMHKLNALFDEKSSMTPMLEQFHQQQWKKINKHIEQSRVLDWISIRQNTQQKTDKRPFRPYVVGHFMFCDANNHVHHFDVEYIIVNLWFYFRVFARLEIIKDVRQSKSAQRFNKNMQHLSQFKRLIDHEVERSKRQGQHLAHLMLSFSKVGDNADSSGEAQTKHFIELVNQRKRQTDILVKINDEVYALFCIDCDAAQAQSIPQYLHSHNDQAYSIDCGIVQLHPFDNTKKLLQRGMSALREATLRDGSNRINIVGPKL